MIINDQEAPQPDSVQWSTPRVIGYTLNGEPVLAADREVTLSFSLQSFPDVYAAFYRLLAERVTFTLPGPDGCETTYAGYISEVGMRLSLSGATDGVDVTISSVVPVLGT